jgi:hypothetical protein
LHNEGSVTTLSLHLSYLIRKFLQLDSLDINLEHYDDDDLDKVNSGDLKRFITYVSKIKSVRVSSLLVDSSSLCDAISIYYGAPLITTEQQRFETLIFDYYFGSDTDTTELSLMEYKSLRNMKLLLIIALQEILS